MNESIDSDGSPQTFAALRILGKTLKTDEITEKLHITPTEARNAGDPRGPSGMWPHSYWQLSSRWQVHSDDLEDHLRWLVNMIETSANELQQLQAEGALVDIFCFWETSASQGGITISPVTLRQIGTLNLTLGIDIYFAT